MDENKVVDLYEVLDRAGVASLAKALLDVVNARINERIVTEIDETSDNNHVASALAVYNAIVKNSHIDLKTYTGRDINEILNPSPTTIYLQRDNEEDTTWMMYVHDAEQGWISIGSTEVDLSDYWSRSDEDMAALKELLGITELREEIASLKSQMEDKVSVSQLYSLTPTDIQAIIAQADEKTANQMVKVGNVVYSELSAAIANCEEGDIVTLTKDISLQNKVVLDKAVCLDMAGHTLKIDTNHGYGFVVVENAVLCLKNGNVECSVNNRAVNIKDRGVLILDNSKVYGDRVILIYAEGYAAVEVNVTSDVSAKDNVAIALFDSASVHVYGTVSSENFYAIGGNGKFGINTKINIYEGAIISVSGSDTPAIYHPGKGVMNIDGGQIVSDCTGVEIRAGTLNMSGGIIKANQSHSEELTCKPNGSGTTTEGAGIAIVQHTTKAPISVNITGGTIESDLAAIFERNVHENLPVPTLAIGVSGDAVVNGPVSVENAANFISGGTFDPQPNEIYLAEGKRFVEENGKFTVQDA